MSQHDMIIANASGAAVRADLNDALAALGSTMKGPNAPPAPIAGMMWLDDDTPSASVWTLKLYDGADWISIATFDISANTWTPVITRLALGAGSAAAPTYSFSGDPDTGIYNSALDEIAISVGGTFVGVFKSSGNFGIGTSSPSIKLEVAALNPQRGILGMLQNQSSSSQTGAQLTFLQNGVNWWTIGQPAATDAFSIWRGRHSGGDGTEVVNIDFAGNLKFNSGYGSAALAFGVRAWVNFNGTGTVAIRASGNVSSITDNGTGDYTVNFTTPMPDANYSYNVAASNGGEPLRVGLNATGGSTVEVAPTTSAFRFYVNNSANSAQVDPKYVNVAVFR